MRNKSTVRAYVYSRRQVSESSENTPRDVSVPALPCARWLRCEGMCGMKAANRACGGWLARRSHALPQWEDRKACLGRSREPDGLAGSDEPERPGAGASTCKSMRLTGDAAVT